ncbi:hypothetical protein, partial [Erwinia amylovora]|uniref:hypothetical protein n=1 Tax=Erwinia amylovora TaxID=552 RepID=UPI0020BE5DF2
KLLEGGKGLSVISALPANAAAMHERIAEDIARRRANAKAKKSAANERAAARRWNRPVRDLSEDWGDRKPLARIVPAHLAKPLG